MLFYLITTNHSGVCGQEHLDSELIGAECRMNNVTVRKNVFSKMNSGKFRSQSAIFSSHRISEFHAAGYTEKRGLSFCGRPKEGHTSGSLLLCSDAMDGATDFAPFIKQLQESPPEMVKSVSVSENTRKTSISTANLESAAAAAAAAAAATSLRPIMLTSILPFEDADDTRYISPGSESPKSPNTRSSGSAFPNLDPGSRPSNLLITGSNVARLGSDLSHPSTTFDDILDEGVSSRSRQNSDGSENYDVLLGIGNNFSLDYDDSHRMIRRNANGEVTTDPGDNSPGDPFKFTRSSSGRSKVRPRNRPASVILRSLGFAAKGNITPQQLQILLRMRELLRTGVDVLKHGRGGRPKKRVLFCESEFSKLCWRKPCALRSVTLYSIKMISHRLYLSPNSQNSPTSNLHMHLNFYVCQLFHFSTVPSLIRTPCTSAQLLLRAVTPAWGASLVLLTAPRAVPSQELDGLSQTVTELCYCVTLSKSVSSFSYMFSYPALPCLALPGLALPLFALN
jgi:hypothetical protein